MKNNKNKKTVAYILWPLIFALVIAGLYFLVGTPVKEFVASKIQTAIILGAPEHDYDAADKDLPAAGKINRSDIAVPVMDRQYGEIICKEMKLKAPLYYGDSDYSLQKGAGQYIGSGMPGEGRTILVGGHDVSFFAPLEKAAKSNVIKVTTQYGRFEYKVSKIVVGTSQSSAADINNKEELVLYTCYPFGDVFGSREKRFFVICEKISGPVITDKEGGNE